MDRHRPLPHRPFMAAAPMPKTALILGATGGVGYESARALARAGWRIRALHRAPDRVQVCLPQAEWVMGDALSADDVTRAAKGASMILHGVNPPGYRDWDRLVLPMLDASIAAAKVAEARLILPGTIYNYGPDAWPLLREDAPQNPAGRKGMIRVAMEDRLRQAAEQEGVRVLILRAGDFFGPHTGNSWFTQAMVRPGRPLRCVIDPGARGVGHAWAHLPDYAETLVRLMTRETELERFARFHFAGHWVENGWCFADRIRRVAGVPNAPIRRLPWGLVRLAAPVLRIARELTEIEPLWRQPVRLDGTRLAAFLGQVPHTPLDEALLVTLDTLDCLHGRAAATAAA